MIGMSAGTDGFRLAYDRIGAGPAVVLLHGWPGDRTDYREVASLLTEFDVVVPDLRGFGGSDKHVAAPAQYGMDGQARAVLGLVDELGLDRPLLAGYDIGSRIAQAAARARPELVRALVVSPPLPGIGQRVLEPQPQREFWYQHFHQLELAEQLIDGRPDAVRAYLRYFWSHWSGPNFTLPAEQLEHLVSVYSPPGAFTASINWYRAGAGAVARSLAERTPDPADRLTTPTTVLWPDLDPLYPPVWSDRVTEYFTTVHLQHLDVGHFTPLESPDKFAAAIRAS